MECDETTAPAPSSPGLWRVAAAAQLFGLSVDAFCAACEDGSLPIRLERIGPRGLRFVRASEVQKFLGECDE